MKHNSFTPLTLQADPQPLSCSRSLSISLPPSLSWFGLLSLCVLPFGFSLSFYFPLRPSLFFPVFDFHSPSAAQGMFSFQMRAKKSCDKVVCVHLFVCVCTGPFSSANGELVHILISSLQCMAKAMAVSCRFVTSMLMSWTINISIVQPTCTLHSTIFCHYKYLGQPELTL